MQDHTCHCGKVSILRHQGKFLIEYTPHLHKNTKSILYYMPGSTEPVVEDLLWPSHSILSVALGYGKGIPHPQLYNVEEDDT